MPASATWLADRMQIGLLTQYYPPEIGAAAIRLGRLARLLAAAGHSVQVLTAMPSYPTGIVPPTYRGKLACRETIEGVEVRRVWSYTSPGKSTLARLLNQTTFMLAAALAGLAMPRPDVLLVESHPLFVCLTGGWLRRLKRAPVVLNVSDLWPESAVATGALTANSLLVRGAQRVERWAYRDAAHIVAMTEGVAQSIRQLIDARGRVTVIRNAVDLDRFRPGRDHAVQVVRQQFAPDDRLLAAYIGNLGLVYDFDTLLDAAAALPDMVFLLAGGGSQQEYLEDQLRARDLHNVRLAGVVPHAEVPALWAAADVCVFALKDHPLFEGTLPAKMFEAMAAGIPVVGAIRGEAAELLIRTGAGVAVSPGDGRGLTAALERLAASPAERMRMGAAGRAYAEASLSAQQAATSFDHILQAAARPGPAAAH